MGKRMQRMDELGEDAVIASLVRGLSSTLPAGVLGPGDDCAVIPMAGSGLDWLLTTDPVQEGVHFLPDTAPRQVGHKAVGRVLSDIAAMGGQPAWLCIDVTAPADYPVAWLQAIYRGARRLADRHGAHIVGGDVGKGAAFALHVFGVGQVPQGGALLRAGARAGDDLYVTGRLGGSLRGRHLTFEPRVEEGNWLRQYGAVTAMMDVSDGLATDLRRLAAASRVGVRLDAAAIPVAAAARRMGDGRSPLAHALSDGEDFELVFTLPAAARDAFQSAWKERFALPCTRIGVCQAARQGIQLLQPDGSMTALDERGYEHFMR